MNQNELIDFDLFVDAFDEMTNGRRRIQAFRDPKFGIIDAAKMKIFVPKGKKIKLHNDNRYSIYCSTIGCESIEYYESYKNKTKRNERYKLLQFVPEDNVNFLNLIIQICSDQKSNPKIKMFKYNTQKHDKIRIVYLVPRKYSGIFQDVISVGIKCKKANAIMISWKNKLTRSSMINKLNSVRAKLDDCIAEIDNINLSILTFMNLDFGENISKTMFQERLVSYIEDGGFYEHKSNISFELKKAFEIISLFRNSSTRSFDLLNEMNKDSFKMPVPYNSIETYVASKALLLQEKYWPSRKQVAIDIECLAALMEAWLLDSDVSRMTLVGKGREVSERIEERVKEVLAWRKSVEEPNGPSLLKSVLAKNDEGIS